MLNEQSQAPQHEQPNWYGQASFIPGEQVDFRKSDLESLDLIQARQAIAAAIRTAPSGSLEVMQPQVEAPQFQVRRIGRMLCSLRTMHDDATFNLEQDDVVRTEMFDTPAPAAANVAQVDFGLAANAPKPDVANSTKDNFDLAA